MDPVSQRRIFFELLPDGDMRFGDPIARPSERDHYVTQGYAYPNPPSHPPLHLPEWGCLTQLLAQKKRVEILTDHVGAYPLYESIAPDKTIIIGGDAWAVARRAGLKRLNPAACFDLLVFEYVPGDETLIDGLTEIAPATRVVFEYADGHWQRRNETAWELQRDISGGAVSTTAAFKNLMDVMAPLAELAQQSDAALPINLSGGWDSRAVLAGALRSGATPTLACSYGNPHYLGVKIARQVADVAGVKHELVPFHNGSFLRENFDRLVRWMPPTARFNLADGALAVGQGFYEGSWAALCGHNGDAFTKIPSRVKKARLDSPADLTAAIAPVMWGAWSGGALQAVLKPDDGEIVRGIWKRLGQSANDVHTPGTTGFFRWKTRNRVRRAVAGELRMLERFTPVILTPLLDRRFIEFWMTVPDEQLLDQRLYRQMMYHQLFSGDLGQLGKIPRESGTLLNPDRWLGGMRESARANFMRVLRRLRPGTAAQMSSADPTALWWESDSELREWAWGLLGESEFISQHFQMDALRRLVLEGQGSGQVDRTFAGIGIWNLLTVPGVERGLSRVDDPERL